MVAVMAINEFGGENTKTGHRVPRRSVIRYVAKNEASTIQKYINRKSRQIIAGQITVDAALRDIGELVKRLMQRRMRNISRPRNKPGTVAAKGKNDPLQDTGALAGAIDAKVSKS